MELAFLMTPFKWQTQKLLVFNCQLWLLDMGRSINSRVRKGECIFPSIYHLRVYFLFRIFSHPLKKKQIHLARKLLILLFTNDLISPVSSTDGRVWEMIVFQNGSFSSEPAFLVSLLRIYIPRQNTSRSMIAWVKWGKIPSFRNAKTSSLAWRERSLQAWLEGIKKVWSYHECE